MLSPFEPATALRRDASRLENHEMCVLSRLAETAASTFVTISHVHGGRGLQLRGLDRESVLQ